MAKQCTFGEMIASNFLVESILVKSSWSLIQSKLELFARKINFKMILFCFLNKNTIDLNKKVSIFFLN